jgi:hypothetical protein
MWAASKATPKGKLPRGKVPRITPSLEGSRNHAIAGTQLGDVPAFEIVGDPDIGPVESDPIGIHAGGETCSVHHFEIAGIAMWFKKTEASHRFGCTLHRDHARLRGGPPSSPLQPKLDVPRLQAISEPIRIATVSDRLLNERPHAREVSILVSYAPSNKLVKISSRSIIFIGFHEPQGHRDTSALRQRASGAVALWERVLPNPGS